MREGDREYQAKLDEMADKIRAILYRHDHGTVLHVIAMVLIDGLDPKFFAGNFPIEERIDKLMQGIGSLIKAMTRGWERKH